METLAISYGYGTGSTTTEELADTLDAAVNATATAWLAADDAWGAELARTYSDPGDARYDDERNAATSALNRLRMVREIAREARVSTLAAANLLRDAGR